MIELLITLIAFSLGLWDLKRQIRSEGSPIDPTVSR